MTSHTRTAAVATPQPSRGHRWTFNVALAVSASMTIWGSLLFQADYARANGWDGRSAYLWPLGVDALGIAAWLAAVACTTWGPKLCGGLAAAVSATGNIAGHAIATGELTPGSFLSGSFPPVATTLVVYLWFKFNPRPSVAAPLPSPVAVPAATAGALDAAASGPTVPVPVPVAREGSPAGTHVGAGTVVWGVADGRAGTSPVPTPVAPRLAVPVVPVYAPWHPQAMPAPRNVLAEWARDGSDMSVAIAYCRAAGALSYRTVNRLGFTDDRSKALARRLNPKSSGGGATPVAPPPDSREAARA